MTYNREWNIKYNKTPLRRFNTSSAMSKRRGHDWNLTFDEFSKLIEKDCYYCEGFFGKSFTGSGLDRINNDLGYSIDNVLPCCSFCNSLRSNLMTVEETKAVVNLLKEMRKVQ